MIELQSYSPRTAAAISRVAACLPAAFSLAGAEAMAVMPGSSSPRIPSDYRRIMMQLDGHHIHVAIDPSLLSPAALAHWPEITAVSIDGALREILFDVVLRDIAVQVEQWCGQRPTWSSSEIAEALPFAILLARRENLDRPLGSVEFDADGLAWIATRCASLPVRCVSLDDLALALDLRLARIRLTMAELQALALGDVVLLEASPVDRDGALTVLLCVSGTSPFFRASIVDGCLTILSVVDRPMDKPDSLPPQTFDDIDLPVDLDVGSLTMPLSHLRELAVGQILDLGFDATTNVSLRVNGQVVAVGELVRVAERTGVRILDLRLPRAEQ